MTSRSSEDEHLHDLARLRRVRDRIDREYARPLDVEALARGAHTSAGHLSREFRLAYGESPYAYLMTRRIERSMALQRRGGLSVSEVCLAVGCRSLGTFSTRFTPGLTEDEQRTIRELMAKGSCFGINLATSDLDRTFANLEGSGAEVVQEPTDQPYGGRDCAFRDPAGNVIQIQELS